MITTLNIQQQAVVTSTAAAISVPASAGSGKSHTLISRIRHRIASGVDPQEIACAVYTQSAARVLADRLKAHGIRLRHTGTLHSLCLKLIGKHGHLIGYRRTGVTICTEEISDDLLIQAAEFLGYRGSHRALVARETDAARLVWSEYEQRLRRNSMVDYRGALTEARRLLDLPEVLAAERLTELLLDEAQDAADIDWSIYRAWPAETKIACFDDSQNIFQFRGSSAQGCLDWTRDAEAVLPLETCYRCAPAICDAANNLIAHNPDRCDKRLRPVDPDGPKGEVTVRQYATDAAERAAVTADIRLLIEAGCEPSEIAVLTRTNHLAQQFRDALHAASIPLLVPVKQQLPDDWRHALAVLTLIADPRNDLVAERVLKHLHPQAAVTRCKEAAALCGEWLSQDALMPKIVPHDAINSLVEFGVSRESRLLVRERHALLPEGSGLLELLSDLHGSERWGDGSEGSGVFCSTAFASKSQEFDVVFIVAAEEGILPMLRKDSDIVSERNLMYVAITRARSEVRISHAEQRQPQWGGVQRNAQSRFISETLVAEF